MFHGHSFTANPLACTAASASIDLLLLNETQRNIERICRKHADFIKRIGEHMRVESARQTGTILAIEWRTETGTSYFDDLRNLLYDYFLNKGILMRPLGNVIYVLPPYCISDEDLDYVYEEIEGALELY
ncbi:aminotransferase class III-fold pyridoxal phosphate-dependent enzyme [Pedobacter sp. NJ-S-72]